MNSYYKLDHLDMKFIICLLVFVLSYSVFFVVADVLDITLLPFEDAAMLMRYSVHLAQGHGIVWNIGDSPVDGCSDFLFMVILAMMIKLGLSSASGTLMIGIFSHTATTAIVYFSVRKLHGSRFIFAFMTAAIIAFGPGLLYIASFWGTPFFALFACLTWYFALSQIYNKN